MAGCLKGMNEFRRWTLNNVSPFPPLFPVLCLLLPVCFHMWNMNHVTRCGRQTLSNRGCFAPTQFQFQSTTHTHTHIPCRHTDRHTRGPNDAVLWDNMRKYLRNPQFNNISSRSIRWWPLSLNGAAIIQHIWNGCFHPHHPPVGSVVCLYGLALLAGFFFLLCNRMRKRNQTETWKFMEFSHRYFRE